MKQKTKNYEMYAGRSRYFETSNEKLEKMGFNETNLKLIKNYQNFLLSTGSGKYRIGKLTTQLRIMLSWKILNCNLDNVSVQDIMNLIAHINKSGKYTPATKSDYRRCIKQFYRWFKRDDELLYSSEGRKRQKFYDFIEEISISYKKKQIDPTSIITEKDCQLLIDKGSNRLKDKALICFLHESGARAGELLNMRIKDIEIRKNIGVAYLDGKTGRRTIQFVKSIGLLNNWINNHPFKDKSNAWLWIKERSNSPTNEPLAHRGLYDLVRRSFERAGLEKKSNPHWMRHSRATLLAGNLTQPLLCKYMGWSLRTRMVETYLHLCSDQLEDAFMRMHNLKQDKELENEFIQCGCGTPNSASERYCAICYRPLRVEDAIIDQQSKNQQINNTVSKMMELMENPELWKKFQDFKQELPTKT